MESSWKDEKYDSFNEYSNNIDIYKDIQSKVTDLYESFPKEIIPENTYNRHYIVTNCLRLKKYLMKFDHEEHCQSQNCCAYINYMLNKTLLSHSKPHEPIFNFYISYINHHSNDMIIKLCGSKINYMAKDKYEKTEKLYDAYELYKLFASKEYGILCSHANLCAKAYNRIITEYSELDDTKFCKALKDFKHVFESNELISTGECRTEIENLLSHPDTCDKLLQKSEQGITSMQQQTQQLDAQVESRGQSDPQRDQTLDVSEENSTSPESIGATLPITLFSSGIGTLLILLSFYKFTPFGHWLRLQKQGLTGISEKLDGVDYEMQQHTSGYEEKDSEYNRYNISYSSL
ncbi:PIR protein [Plasmodium ovale]|uniref:PIR protein n=1 Tax=Plasmodium ovale TaxID=36330 RepID=A0A1C3KHI9_PLAOA|nr:PIR protein [Plasmodium ovale]